MFKSPKQPHCLCCRKSIAKVCDMTAFSGHSFQGKDRPIVRTKTEAQRYVNLPIVSVSYRKVYDDDVTELKVVDRIIATVSTWDGETYVDGWFCNGSCRTRWAYAAARRQFPDGYITQ